MIRLYIQADCGDEWYRRHGDADYETVQQAIASELERLSLVAPNSKAITITAEHVTVF